MHSPLILDHANSRERWIAKIGVALIAGAAIAALEVAYYRPLMGTAIDLSEFAALLLQYCPRALWLLLAFEVAQRFAHPRAANAVELGVALVIGTFVANPTTEALEVAAHDHLGLRNFRDAAGEPTEWLGGMIYNTWLTLLFGALAFALCAARLRLQRMFAALRQAELERARSAQQLAQARFSALKARVDPDQLLDTIERLANLYETDLSAAERLMDEFIASLREARTEVFAGIGVRSFEFVVKE